MRLDSYVLLSPQSSSLVTFHVAAYDASKPLVIDPVLSYSTYLGGSDSEWGRAIAVDDHGNAYVTGFADLGFPTTDGAFQVSHGGGFDDAFVTKLNPTGSTLVYSTYLGGSDFDLGHNIAVDSSGNTYVTGWTKSTDFPTANPFQAANSGDLDAFVTKLNATGNALVYSTYLGGSGHEFGSGIAVDSSGNAYVTGRTSSTDFPTASPLQPTHGGGIVDAFVAKVLKTLTASLTASPKRIKVGRTITVKMKVKNTGSGTATVTPSALTVDGTGTVQLSSGPTPLSATIRSRRIKTFTWRYQTTKAGTVRFTGSATSPQGESPLATSNKVTVATTTHR